MNNRLYYFYNTIEMYYKNDLKIKLNVRITVSIMSNINMSSLNVTSNSNKSNMFDKCYFTTITLQTIINYFILDTTNFFQVITNNGTYPPNILSIIEPITYSVSDYSLDVTNKLLFFRNCVLECIKLYQIYLKCEKEINTISTIL